MYSIPLLNAARAFALVCYSDGNLEAAEARRFSTVASLDPDLQNESDADIDAAWTVAAKEILESKSFGGPLLAIRTEMKTDAQKALLMRIAQAAVVADRKQMAQEDVAVRSLAEALGLDPEKYLGG